MEDSYLCDAKNEGVGYGFARIFYTDIAFEFAWDAGAVPQSPLHLTVPRRTSNSRFYKSPKTSHELLVIVEIYNPIVVK